MRSELFDFELPMDRVALEPSRPRDAARLLVVVPAQTAAAGPAASSTAALGGAPRFIDSVVGTLPDLLRRGDALVLNDTRVIRAALVGERRRGELRATVSFNLHKRLDDSRWLAFARPAKRLAAGDRIRLTSAHTGANLV